MQYKTGNAGSARHPYVKLNFLR